MIMSIKASESGVINHALSPGSIIAAGDLIASLKLKDPSKVPHRTALHYTALHCTTQNCTTLHYTKLHYTKLRSRVQYSTILYNSRQYNKIHYSTVRCFPVKKIK